MSQTVVYDHLLDAKSDRRTRRATIHALEWVLLPHKMNSYGGYDETTGPTWHPIDDKERGWYLHYCWNSRFTGGVARITHRKSAQKRKKSKVTSQRWARRLHRLGLVEKTNVPDPNGGLGPNLYRPLDPSYSDGPQGDALAIVYSGRLRVLTAQPIEIPPVPGHTVPPEKPKTKAPLRNESPAQLPLPSSWGMAIARAVGLHDRLELALLWTRYQEKKATGKVQRAAAYWRGMCENRVRELKAEGKLPSRLQQQVISIRHRTPDEERVVRRRFMVEQAALLLAEGYDVPQVIQRVMDFVYPAGLCVNSGPSIEDVRLAVEEAQKPAQELRAQRERQRQPIIVGAETKEWLRRVYCQLEKRGQTAEERRLFGDRSLTPARAAMVIAQLPNRPSDLRQASEEQIEKLLQEL